MASKLARKSITAETIAAWERGTGSPSYPLLETLAHLVYRRPLAVFFFPNVPDEKTPKTEFRTLPDTVADDLPPSVMKLYRKAKLFQIYLEELYEGAKPVEVPLLDQFQLDGKYQVGSVTQEIRKALGISIEEQSQWRRAETAFKRWREALEARGVFVFKDAFRDDNYSGFCLFAENYPIIFVNNSMPDSRQVFTLFHELGHLLFHSGGIDFRSREAANSFQGYFLDVEVTCNRFANEFLVPGQVLDSVGTEVSEAHFDRLAEYFSVSREVILRNYLDRGLVDVEYYERMAAEWAEQAKERRGSTGGGGNYYFSLRTHLGERYINLVYGRYYKNKITAENVAEYLNIKPKNLPNFEHVVMEGGKL
ncbi:MAG: ImmA/IrrE family metallo-endopeptidase [Chloroflexi bacterium]|nr:ImmA/IrrE family metallo-endopeptidase [Chloroflexota bacterium]